MKFIALSPKGYWYSRRNRMDLFVTFAGILWSVLHFIKSKDYVSGYREAVDTLGYIVIILRFCTITGKHVSKLFFSCQIFWIAESLNIAR